MWEKKYAQGYNYVRNSLNSFLNRNQAVQQNEDSSTVNTSYISEVLTKRTYGTTLTWKFIISKTTGNYVKDVEEILNQKKVKNAWRIIFEKYGSFTLNNMKVRSVKEKENKKIFYEVGFQNKRHMPITDVSMFENYFSLTHSYFFTESKSLKVMDLVGNIMPVWK